MISSPSKVSSSWRPFTFVLAAAMATAPLAACGKSTPPPPVDDSRSGHATEPGATATGMSTKKKVVMLAGAAALYYLYKHHQDAAAKEGAEGQYYMSKNGRVYYRDADHRAHWVTPPPGGIQVPEAEAEEYRKYQGYDNSPTGRDLTGISSDAEPP